MVTGHSASTLFDYTWNLIYKCERVTTQKRSMPLQEVLLLTVSKRRRHATPCWVIWGIDRFGHEGDIVSGQHDPDCLL